METINGISVINLSGQPLGKVASFLPPRLQAERYVLLPDLGPSKAVLPTGCVALMDPEKVQDWRKYTISDVGCGIALYSSDLKLEEFEKFKPEWDRILVEITGRKGSLGELGGGNHFLDAVSNQDGRIYFVIHTGSRDEGERLPELLAAPKEFDAEFQRIVEWARKNRDTIAGIVVKYAPGVKLVLDKHHNFYESVDGKILMRKGAVRFHASELALIPSTMDTDMALVTAKDNVGDILNSISHGTGRVMSRGDAKASFRDYDFQALRKRIYIPAAISDHSMITENPACYRRIEHCLPLIASYVQVKEYLTPIAYIGQV